MDERLGTISTTKLAGLDLSGWQYRFVKFSGAYVVKSSTRDTIHGVLQNKPSVSGQAADVVIHGITNVITDGTITAGAYVMSDASGRADVLTHGTGTAVDCAGYALEVDGAAGSQVQILFQRMPTEL